MNEPKGGLYRAAQEFRWVKRAPGLLWIAGVGFGEGCLGGEAGRVAVAGVRPGWSVW
jgi:hypothetical protein